MTNWDATIYLVTCPHRQMFGVDDDSAWCDSCDKWVHGKPVGNVQIELENNDEVVVWGRGWMLPDEDPRRGREDNER